MKTRTYEKIKRQIIRALEFTLAKKGVPAEEIDHIDFESVVEIEPSVIKAYEQANRKGKGEIVSEQYHITLLKLLEAYPGLKKYFKEKADLLSAINDKRKFVESLWNTYLEAESGDKGAIEIMHSMGFDSLDAFRRKIEEEEKELAELEKEFFGSKGESKDTREERKPEQKKLTEEEETFTGISRPGKLAPLTTYTEEQQKVYRALKPLLRDMLVFVCRSVFLGAGLPIMVAKERCRDLSPEIDKLVDDIINGDISKENAVSKVQELALSNLPVEPVEERENIRIIEEKPISSFSKRKRKRERELEREERETERERAPERRGGWEHEYVKFPASGENILLEYGCQLLLFGYTSFVNELPESSMVTRESLIKAIKKWGNKLKRSARRGIDIAVGYVLTDLPEVVVDMGIRQAVIQDWDSLSWWLKQNYEKIYEELKTDLPLMIMGRALKLAGCLYSEMPEDIRRAYVKYEELFGEE